MSYSGYSIRRYVEQELGTLPHFVIYAILEWTLIGLIFLDGFLAFVSSIFAAFFDLQAPCVLCTRIDHILSCNQKLRYRSNESICEGHMKDLSSLAYCHVHRKLSDIKTMCKGCLLSFATDNNRSDGNKDLELLFDDEMKARLQLQPQWTDDTGNGNGNEKLTYCSCCGEAMKAKPTGYQNGSVGNISSNSGILSRVPSLKKVSSLRRNPSRLSQQAPAPSPRTPFGPSRAEDVRTTLELSHIRCCELKTSETTIPDEEDTANATIPTAGKDETKLSATPMPTESDEFMEGFGRTASFGRGNRFFGIPNSAVASPRFANRMPRKSLLDKVELGSDPVEALTGNETDTEVIMNRLKSQVRLDRNSLIALYMELDEERSASSVAANNAMAMITRLQAEKASVHMEALQYQRMMEEQAEYDKEDIQMLKDFLNKKEDEINDLEAELDLYRERFGLPDVTRDDALKRSQSFSSISENGSPLFSIGSFYEEGENISGRHKNDDVGGSSHEDGEYIEPLDDDDDHSHKEDDVGESSEDIEKYPGVDSVENFPLFSS